ncbi:hypothetical protein HanRHA438_Chr09g0420851 [Helianthus annuus]|nr:hypothetical protein HanRHA438_Chr09g0420851 [Helianthus annuus]
MSSTVVIALARHPLKILLFRCNQICHSVRRKIEYTTFFLLLLYSHLTNFIKFLFSFTRKQIIY